MSGRPEKATDFSRRMWVLFYTKDEKRHTLLVSTYQLKNEELLRYIVEVKTVPEIQALFDGNKLAWESHLFVD
jgi:hypothetical protein